MSLQYLDNSQAIQLITILKTKIKFICRYENQVLRNNVLTFIDNEADPTIVINVDIFRGQFSFFPLNLESLTNTLKSIDWEKGFLTNFKNDPKIKWDELADKVGPLNRIGLEKHFTPIEKASFACNFIDYDNEMIESLNGYFTKTKPDDEIFDTLSLTIENPQEKIIELKKNLDGNESLLVYEDAETVNEKWQYRSNESVNFLRWSCEQPVSAGYRIKNEETGEMELVSWIIMYSDGSIGSLYTNEKYRGKGLAKKVVSFILIKFLESGYNTPYCYVNINNKASQVVMRSFGFTSVHQAKWVTAFK